MTNANQSRVPSINDVAARAGVSIATVSNVLNHPAKVSPDTIQRVNDAIAELGFARNSAARQLAAGQSKTVGLVIVDISNSLFVDIARGAQRSAVEVGFNVLVANSDNDFERQNADLAFFDEARVAGILLAPMQDSTQGIERARRHGRPVVVLNYDAQPHDCCAVLVDNEKAGYIAAKHMIDIGRTRLAFVGGRDYLQPVHRRRMGVQRAVAETRGRVRLEEIETADLTPASGSSVGGELSARTAVERPDGIIAVTDLLGMAIVQELSSAGISVPTDVAVMGCDHNSAAWGGTIPLTSVQMRGLEMGAEGFRLLLQEVASNSGDHVHEIVMLEPALVVRESTIGRSGGVQQDL